MLPPKCLSLVRELSGTTQCALSHGLSCFSQRHEVPLQPESKHIQHHDILHLVRKGFRNLVRKGREKTLAWEVVVPYLTVLNQTYILYCWILGLFTPGNRENVNKNTKSKSYLSKFVKRCLVLCWSASLVQIHQSSLPVFGLVRDWY